MMKCYSWVHTIKSFDGIEGTIMGFTIPKITISADYGDDSSFGDVSVISVGYGCHQAWVYACMFGASLFPTAGVRLNLSNSLATISLMYVVSIVVF